MYMKYRCRLSVKEVKIVYAEGEESAFLEIAKIADDKMPQIFLV